MITTGPVKLRAAMHDAMSDAEDSRAAVLSTAATRRGHRAPASVAHVAASSFWSVELAAVAHPWPSIAATVPMPSIWPRASSRQLRACGPPVDAELQARRAGVEDQSVIIHGRTLLRQLSRGARAPPASRRRSSRSATGRCRRGWSG